MANIEACLSSRKEDWCTPPVVIEAVLRFARLVGRETITLDPCTGPGSIVPAERVYSVEDDGLSQQWAGLVYANPPYGRKVSKWVRKCNAEARPDTDIIALVASRTDTAWYHDAEFTSVCHWRGRLTFIGAPSSAPFPSAVLYWGQHRGAFWEAFSKHGRVS